MKKTNKIFALAMTFVMGFTVATPLFAQDLPEIEKSPMVVDTIQHVKRVLTEEQKEQLSKYEKQPMKDHMSVEKQNLLTILKQDSGKSMIMLQLFASAIQRNDAVSFDIAYNYILNDNNSELGRDYLRLSLILTFGLFDYIGSEEEKTELIEAMSSKNLDSIDTFMQLYSEIEDSEKQEVLENTFSKFQLNEAGRKLIPTRIDKFPKKI